MSKGLTNGIISEADAKELMKVLGYTEYSIDEITYTNSNNFITYSTINTSLPTQVKHIIMYAKNKPAGSWASSYYNVWKIEGDVQWKTQSYAYGNGSSDWCFPTSLTCVRYDSFFLNYSFLSISLSSISQDDGVIKVSAWYNNTTNPSVDKLYLLPTTYQIICFG